MNDTTTQGILNMPSHGCTQEWMQEIVLLIDNELPENRRQATESHIAQCRACQVYYHSALREERLLAGQVQHDCNPLPPAFANQIMAEVDRHAVPSYLQISFNHMYNVYEYLKGEGKWHAAVAVSIFVCFIATYMSFQVRNPADIYRVPMLKNGEPYTAILPERFHVNSNKGEFFYFPVDGSVVYATSGTSFVLSDYPKNIANAPIDAERRLELQYGDLFLDVAKADQGFTVITLNAETKVWGTQFLVSASKGKNKHTRVAVYEGSVMVEKRNHHGYTVLSDNLMTQISGIANSITMLPPREMGAKLKAHFRVFDNAIDKKTYQVPQNGIPSIQLDSPLDVSVLLD